MLNIFKILITCSLLEEWDKYKIIKFPFCHIFAAVNVSTSSVTGVMTPNQVPMRQFSVSQQLNTPLSSASIQQRAIMGQNTLQTASPNMPPRPMNISPNPLTRPIVGTPVSQNFSMGIPITGRMPIPQGGVNMSPSPLVLQQMMQGGISPATARGNLYR